MRRSLITFAVLCIVGSPLSAYTIYLKDGTTVQAKQKYAVDGERAIITLPSGTRTFLQLSEIDVERTERMNHSDYGTAIVLEGGSLSEQPVTPPEEAPSMAELAAETRQERQRALPPRPTTTERAAPSIPSGRLASGAPDLAALPLEEFGDTTVMERVRERFRTHGLGDLQILRGSRGDRLRLLATTDTEATVFRAIVLAAASLLELEEAGLADLDAVELVLQTSGGERAGQFVITPELARQLIDEELDLPTFYVEHVQF